jgi:soluble lytic murein transglycosylase-like protein
VLARYSTLKSRLLAPALAALLLGSGMAAFASSGKTYVSKRIRLHCDRQLTYATVQANPAAYIGRVVELRGIVSGSMETDTGLTVMLEQPDHSAVNLDIPKSESGPLEECSTPHLRVLARIGDSSSGNVVALTALAVAEESEVSAIEQAHAARYAALQRVQQERQAALRVRPHRQAAAPLPSRSSFGRPMLTASALAEMARYYDAHLGPRVKPLFGAYCEYIADRNSRLSPDMAGLIAASLLHFADQYDIDPRLVVAMMIAESGFDPNATSRVGAAGLGQLMPGTARALGVDNPYDPVKNIAGSVNYLRSRLDTFADRALPGGGLSIEQAAYALAAYNAGTGAVRKYHGIPPYRETQAYVRRVISLYEQLCNGN